MGTLRHRQTLRLLRWLWIPVFFGLVVVQARFMPWEPSLLRLLITTGWTVGVGIYLYRYRSWDSTLADELTANASVFYNSPKEAALVHCRLTEEGVITGQDLGVLWLEGNLLAFKGCRTCFAIGLGAVDRLSYVQSPVLGGVRPIVLKERGLVGQRTIVFAKREPLANQPILVRGSASKIVDAFRGLDGGTVGELPPFEPGPGAEGPRVLAWKAIGRGAWTGYCASMVLSMMSNIFDWKSGWYLPANVGLLIGAGTLGLVSSWKNIRKAHRIQRAYGESRQESPTAEHGSDPGTPVSNRLTTAPSEAHAEAAKA